MKNHPFIYQIDDTLDVGNVRYEVHLTDAGRSSGLTAMALARQLRDRFYGAEVDQVVRHKEEIEVMARYPVEKRARTSDLHDELIGLPNGDVAAFSSIAEIAQTQDLKQRQRIDGLPAASVNGLLQRGDDQLQGTRAGSSREAGCRSSGRNTRGFRFCLTVPGATRPRWGGASASISRQPSS